VANKTELTILEDTDLQFTIDGHRFMANVLVSPAVDEFLLGSVWLVQSEAKWDFAAGTISLGDKLIHAYRRTFNEVCCRIMASKDCAIPTLHEAKVSVKIQDDELPHPPGDWTSEPQRLELGVIVVQTLFSDSHNQPVARICNYCNKPYTFTFPWAS